MSRRILGVDPGVTGALALLEGGELTHVIDMPIYASRVQGGTLADIIREADPHYVVVEDTHPMPKNGSIASFKLGLNTGAVGGVVQALGHPLVRVRPMLWKKRNGLINQPKDASRGLVQELYPDMAHYFKRVKDQGRADAVLIARYWAFEIVRIANEEAANA